MRDFNPELHRNDPDLHRFDPVLHLKCTGKFSSFFDLLRGEFLATKTRSYEDFFHFWFRISASNNSEKVYSKISKKSNSGGGIFEKIRWARKARVAGWAGEAEFTLPRHETERKARKK